MQILYKLGALDLDKHEVKTLLSHATDEISITVDLKKHIRGLDSKALFAEAVEAKDTRLATLAAKLAMEGGRKFNPARKRSYRKTGEKSVLHAKIIDQDPFESLEEILSKNSLKNVGAAMILNSLEDGDRRSLREIAEDVVNHMEKFSHNSPDDSPRLFRGFEKTRHGFIALMKPQKKGQCQYHHAPVYTALRDGLKYLATVGLVDIKSEKTYGALDKKKNNNAGHLHRNVYTIALSKGGMTLMRNWNDSDDYISGFWKQR